MISNSRSLHFSFCLLMLSAPAFAVEGEEGEIPLPPRKYETVGASVFPEHEDVYRLSRIFKDCLERNEDQPFAALGQQIRRMLRMGDYERGQLLHWFFEARRHESREWQPGKELYRIMKDEFFDFAVVVDK